MFNGQDSVTVLPPPGLRDVQRFFCLHKGDLHSTCKALPSNCNPAHSSSHGNTILYGVLPTSEDDFEALTARLPHRQNCVHFWPPAPYRQHARSMSIRIVKL